MFELHPTLAQDTHHVLDWPLCRVLLMNDATYPWLILSPMRNGLRDLDDLAASDQHQAMREMTLAAGVLKSIYRPDKINTAALGNMVEQLHIHVIARFTSDPAWPAPIWGAAPPVPYTPEDLNTRLDELRTALSAALRAEAS